MRLCPDEPLNEKGGEKRGRIRRLQKAERQDLGRRKRGTQEGESGVCFYGKRRGTFTFANYGGGEEVGKKGSEGRGRHGLDLIQRKGDWGGTCHPPRDTRICVSHFPKCGRTFGKRPSGALLSKRLSQKKKQTTKGGREKMYKATTKKGGKVRKAFVSPDLRTVKGDL